MQYSDMLIFFLKQEQENAFKSNIINHAGAVNSSCFQSVKYYDYDLSQLGQPTVCTESHFSLFAVFAPSQHLVGLLSKKQLSTS